MQRGDGLDRFGLHHVGERDRPDHLGRPSDEHPGASRTCGGLDDLHEIVRGRGRRGADRHAEEGVERHRGEGVAELPICGQPAGRPAVM